MSADFTCLEEQKNLKKWLDNIIHGLLEFSNNWIAGRERILCAMAQVQDGKVSYNCNIGVVADGSQYRSGSIFWSGEV